jgi:peptidoglycan/LPS O-acetylase OafA/YrhL
MPAAPNAAFPFNFPVWSLFYELVANFVYAALVKRLTTTIIIIIVITGFCGMAIQALGYDTLDSGSDLRDYSPALARVTFSFLTGVFLYRLWPEKRRDASGLPSMIALAAIMAIPIWSLHGVVDLFAATLVFPTIVFFSASIQPSRRLARFYLLLGRLSYPIYALHYPILTVGFAMKAKLALTGTWLYAFALLELGFIIVIAYIALIVYDEPVRSWLRSNFGSQRSAKLRSA